MGNGQQDDPPTVAEVLAALKVLAQDQGWQSAWALLPPGMVLLASWLEGVDGLGPELATEVAVVVAMHWQEGARNEKGV